MTFIESWFDKQIKTKRGGVLLLLDPDKGTSEELGDLAVKAEEAGASAVLVGSSLLLGNGFEMAVREIKKRVNIPVFLFPGNGHQVTREADGILFLSLISGRNPRWLIEEQVESAPKIKAIGISTLPTAYILIESGRVTAVQFMSATVPIPRNKPDIVLAHAIAAEMMGSKAIFLEAGSGAEKPVPSEVISVVRSESDLPLIVGGGIRDFETAKRILSAGADFIVVGTQVEETGDISLIKEIAKITHEL
ncbi:geranylgeranylglyceryl/heptaprenylglyceryl phosphate synthase [bacterium]|nr:geranylgeranylglyceryl/heptaprenylglyceryl phosphate synthase [bacterium]